MFLQRSALTAARRVAVGPVATRTFTSSFVARKSEKVEAPAPAPDRMIKTFDELKTDADLLPPGALPGTVPDDIEQATGLERLEILGKMQGVDVFDMRPLDASRKGTLADPIIVNSAGDEQFAGCTGYPAGDHSVLWLKMTRERPVERCTECGSVYKMAYIGPPDDPHAHDDGHHHGYTEPKNFADYVRPEYRTM